MVILLGTGLLSYNTCSQGCPVNALIDHQKKGQAVRNDIVDKGPARPFVLSGCGGAGLIFLVSEHRLQSWGEALSRALGSGKLTNGPPIVLLQHPTLRGLETDADKHCDPD